MALGADVNCSLSFRQILRFTLGATFKFFSGDGLSEGMMAVSTYSVLI